ncbi:MAG: S-methyl-5'-thioadenosine phosphorylase [Elusimicrobiota bacterium]
MEPVKIGVIGGSGVYEIEGIKDLKELKIKTPFGYPSDAIVTGELEGVRCAFLPRHARGHRILPSEINFRANIYALKSLGVEKIISISACGSLKEEFKPKDFTIPDQLYDRTKTRRSTFFGDGIVAHIQFGHPFCENVRKALKETMDEMRISNHYGGTYVCMEGPAFSTKSESETYRKMGFSIIGMTAVPEAKLAREAEICYATIGLVTDYDCWKEHGEEVSAGAVVEVVHQNVANVKRLIKLAVPKLAKTGRECACSEALKYAIMSKLDAKNAKTQKKLELLLGKYKK